MSEMVEKVIFQQAVHGDWSKDNVIKSYLEHNEAVKKECPADKLLVFEVTEGWGPLCAFLKKPIPDVPFPNINDAEHFKKLLRGLDMLGKAILVAAVTMPLVAVGGFAYWQSKCN
jgi:hypothetical protein